MSKVISVENVSKFYRLGLIGGGTLASDLQRWWAKIHRRPDPLLKIGQQDQANRQGEYIWALREVSFTVEQGEVLGIIGRNGAGKSTLLKILSRVTAPTSGEIKVKGRIASLLEVGTGFHPELTGRENIFLNGAILGMNKTEIRRKFDEIVSFAEIEQFIDTPVKRYSSGMYVRLAFAVAAHLEPEILLIDEVLAVGDAAFQKKCLGKMGDVAKQGRTVLFVSHNMASILALCNRVILLDQGQIAYNGPAETGIKQYTSGQYDNNASVVDLSSVSRKMAYGEPVIHQIRFIDQQGEPKNGFAIGEPVIISIELKPRRKLSYPIVGIGINDSLGTRVTTLSTKYQGEEIPAFHSHITIECGLQDLALAPGSYGVKIAVGSGNEDLDIIELENAFDILPTDYWGSGKLPLQSQGVVLTKANWKFYQNGH